MISKSRLRSGGAAPGREKHGRSDFCGVIFENEKAVRGKIAARLSFAPFGGMTRIRFKGFALSARLSQPAPLRWWTRSIGRGQGESRDATARSRLAVPFETRGGRELSRTLISPDCRRARDRYVARGEIQFAPRSVRGTGASWRTRAGRREATTGSVLRRAMGREL